MTAAPAEFNFNFKNAFTLLEVLAVVTIIGILSVLAYASLVDLIFTNRAKETAQTLRTFTERALAEGKRQNESVTIKLVGNSITASKDVNGAETEIASEALGAGFNRPSDAPNCLALAGTIFADSVKSEFRIGLSGIAEEGYFAVCGARDYCAAAVKARSNNSFVACIKRRNSNWEAL